MRAEIIYVYAPHTLVHRLKRGTGGFCGRVYGLKEREKYCSAIVL